MAVISFETGSIVCGDNVALLECGILTTFLIRSLSLYEKGSQYVGSFEVSTENVKTNLVLTWKMEPWTEEWCCYYFGDYDFIWRLNQILGK